jgi:hypothetical protein
MTLPIYPWQEPYLKAVQETDDAKMPHHLLEAMAAVEQRLLSPIQVNSLEYKAIENTRRGIDVLRQERCGNPQSPATHQQPDHSETR